MIPCITEDGQYGMVDVVPIGAIEVPERPNPTDKWDGEAWVPDPVLLWEAVRTFREPLLVEADHQWNKANDLGQDTTSISAYRQALRDITAQPDPLNIEWPVKPW